MRAQLKSISSEDYPDNHIGLPLDPQNAWVIVDAEIGPQDGRGSELFRFYVCTPAFLASDLKDKGYYFGRHLLILAEFSWELVKTAIEKIISSFDESNWSALAEKIGRYGYWEFEDYQINP